MTKTKKSAVSMILVLLALALCLAFHAAPAHAAEYTRNATLNPTSSAYPGVYYVKAVPGDSNATIGIPSLDKNTLDAPTTESPAIIMGADTGSATAAQNADFKLKFYIDQTADYNPSFDYDPQAQNPTSGPTHAEQVMAKFYDETKAPDAQVTS